MRYPKFKVKRFEKNGYVFYGVHAPAYLNASGKAGYMYFPTKAEAERGRQQLLEAVSTQSRVLVLSNAQQVDAQRALERLAEAGLSEVSLLQAVEAALPVLCSRGVAMKVEVLCEEFAVAKAASWSATSKRNFATVSKLFLAEFAGRDVREVSARDLEGWLSVRFPSAGYKANVIRTLRPAFSYALRQDYIEASPFEKLERVRVRANDGVEVYSPEEVRLLMQAAPLDCVGGDCAVVVCGD